MDPSFVLSLFSTGWSLLLPSSPPRPSLRVSLDRISEGEVALSASVAISIGDPESLFEDPTTLLRLALASANELAGKHSLQRSQACFWRNFTKYNHGKMPRGSQHNSSISANQKISVRTLQNESPQSDCCFVSHWSSWMLEGSYQPPWAP